MKDGLKKVKALAEQLIAAVDACENKEVGEEEGGDNAPEPSDNDEVGMKSLKMTLGKYKE